MTMRYAAFAAALAVAAAAGPAQADILKFVANTQEQVFTGSQDLTINEDNGAFSTRFKVKRQNFVVITFTAECLLTGNNGSFLEVDILVKLEGTSTFEPLKPTDGDNSFCAPGNNTGFYWVGASVAGGGVMPVGNHTVKVNATVRGTATQARIDDLALYVID
jgi:hypothetical protein